MSRFERRLRKLAEQGDWEAVDRAVAEERGRLEAKGRIAPLVDPGPSAAPEPTPLLPTSMAPERDGYAYHEPILDIDITVLPEGQQPERTPEQKSATGGNSGSHGSWD
jgi:hypothetical protein